MKTNIALNGARRKKNDEFYTLYEDIEEAVELYKDYFKGKKVLCNCNNSESSNFYKYFTDHFKELGLKKLTCTTYSRGGGHGTKLSARLDKDGQLCVDKLLLNGDGDFSSEECIALLEDCDIVCDNPPFSLFRQFVQLLEDHHKKYLILGNLNTIVTKEIFPLIKDGKSWVVPRRKVMSFEYPDEL